jgi:biofilm PGA synthesis N-glycosyltransferase PgaC
MSSVAIIKPSAVAEVQPSTGSNIQYYRNVPIKKGAISFVLPCYNEEKDLSAALRSVMGQESPVDTILVVSDNSTDRTVEIARSAGVSVIETRGNTAKKAGALNAGLQYLMGRGYLPEFVITGDGDTVYDDQFVKRAVRVMNASPKLGVLSAVCYGKAKLVSFPSWPQRQGARRGHRKPQNQIERAVTVLSDTPAHVVQWLTEFFNYSLVWLQRAEYARAAMLRLRQNIHTTSGAGSVLRGEAIVDVLYAKYQLPQKGRRSAIKLYHEGNFVEDFALTLDVKEAGWSCTNNFHVVAHTDLMRDLPSLFSQRTRWVRGTIDELRRRKGSRGSRASALSIGFGVLSIPFNYALYAFPVMGIVSGHTTLMDFWFFPVMGIYQAIMVRKLGWRSMIVAFVLLPEVAFGVVRHCWIFTSLKRSFLSNHQVWE